MVDARTIEEVAAREIKGQIAHIELAGGLGLENIPDLHSREIQGVEPFHEPLQPDRFAVERAAVLRVQRRRSRL